MAVNKNFVIKHGVEVSDNLIYANPDVDRVGIGTTVLNHTLEVNGGIGATNLQVSGIATITTLVATSATITSLNIGAVASPTVAFSTITATNAIPTNLDLTSSTISIGGSVGSNGQYLISTGSGVNWISTPTARTSTTIIASPAQTSISYTYTVGLVDVYINGVKLAPTEFTANDGVSITLNQACFGGESIEVIAYAVSSLGAGTSGIQGITIQNQGITTGTPLNITSLNFVGASVTAVNSGVGVTVYISDNVGTSSQWVSTAAGIHTLSSVGIGTTNPRFALEVGAVGASGTTLYVNGDARITGILTVGSSSITLNGATNTINVGSGVTINGTAGTISATSFVGDGSGLVNVVGSGSGIVVLDDGSTVGTAGTINFGTNLSVSAISAGVVTVTASGGTSTQWVSAGAGIHTLSNVGVGTTNPTSALTVNGVIQTGVGSNFTFVSSAGFTGDGPEGRYLQLAYQTNPNYILNNVGIGTTNATSRLTVKGNTSLETLNVSGVSTFANGSVSIGSSVIGMGGLQLSQVGTAGYITNTDGGDFHINTLFPGKVYIKTSNDNEAVTCNQNGSVELHYSNSDSNKKLETLGAGVTVTGTTFTNQLSVSGVSTFSGNVRVGVDTSSGVILTSPNGTQYRLIVDNSGTLSTVAV